MDTPKTKGGNEPYTFMLELIGRETSLSKESLKSIKVNEGKCEDDIRIIFSSSASYFAMKATRTTFTTDVVIPWVRIVP
jgi:hypothetical protein